VLVEILAGLHYAHELTDYNGAPLGVVHRDVSPDNVFVTYDGQVKLMDFGVAKSTAAANRTRPGAVKGKLAYLAPEYFRSEIVDRRADVFAVGVMLWEMLAGRRLWAGLGEAQIVHHLAAGMPMPALPPDENRPPLLDGICARALAISPGDRYRTAAELELDLQGVLAGTEDSHARTLGRVVSNAFQAVRAEREALISRDTLLLHAVADSTRQARAVRIDLALVRIGAGVEQQGAPHPAAAGERGRRRQGRDHGPPRAHASGPGDCTRLLHAVRRIGDPTFTVLHTSCDVDVTSVEQQAEAHWNWKAVPSIARHV
jgi:serine/threonine-protein kinase